MHSTTPVACLGLLLAACSSAPTPPGSAPIPREAAAGPPVPPGAPLEEPGGPLTLGTALALALQRSPWLSAASREVRAAEAGLLRAGLPPDPEASYSVENAGGSLRGESESTILLSQLIELGGKRAARVAAAEGGVGLATRDLEARRLDVLASTASAFVAVLAAQARVEVAEESRRIAGEILDATLARSRAGAVSPTEVLRSEMEAASADAERERSAAALRGARARLSANWGESTPRFTACVGDLPLPDAVPPEERLLPLLERNPDLARFDAEIAVLRAEADAAGAGRVPDLTLGIGRRRFEETGGHGYLFEAAVPLPLFGGRRGAVDGAEARLAAARMRRNAVHLELRARLSSARADLEGAMGEWKALRNGIVPRAREILAAAAEGYRAGKLGQIDLLDAQRRCSEVAARESRVLAEVHGIRIEMERLIAGPLDGLPAAGPGGEE